MKLLKTALLSIITVSMAILAQDGKDDDKPVNTKTTDKVIINRRNSGVTVAPLSETLRQHVNVTNDQGLIIRRISVASPLVNILNESDIIKSINDQNINSKVSFYKVLTENNNSEVSFKFIRAGKDMVKKVNLSVAATEEGQPTTGRDGEIMLPINTEDLKDLMNSNENDLFKIFDGKLEEIMQEAFKDIEKNLENLEIDKDFIMEHRPNEDMNQYMERMRDMLKIDSQNSGSQSLMNISIINTRSLNDGSVLTIKQDNNNCKISITGDNGPIFDGVYPINNITISDIPQEYREEVEEMLKNQPMLKINESSNSLPLSIEEKTSNKTSVKVDENKSSTAKTRVILKAKDGSHTLNYNETSKELRVLDNSGKELYKGQFTGKKDLENIPQPYRKTVEDNLDILFL